MVEVTELLLYNKEVRNRYFETLSKLPWDELTKNREASYHSLRNIFIHTLNAIDYWLDILMKENKRQTQRQFEEYKSIDDIRMVSEHQRTRSYALDHKRTHKYGCHDISRDSQTKKWNERGPANCIVS